MYVPKQQSSRVLRNNLSKWEKYFFYTGTVKYMCRKKYKKKKFGLEIKTNQNVIST